MKSLTVKLPSVFNTKTETLVDINGITFRINALQQMTYDGAWEAAGFYLYLANELIGHFWGYPSNDDVGMKFQTYMTNK